MRPYQIAATERILGKINQAIKIKNMEVLMQGDLFGILLEVEKL